MPAFIQLVQKMKQTDKRLINVWTDLPFVTNPTSYYKGGLIKAGQVM